MQEGSRKQCHLEAAMLLTSSVPGCEGSGTLVPWPCGWDLTHSLWSSGAGPASCYNKTLVRRTSEGSLSTLPSRSDPRFGLPDHLDLDPRPSSSSSAALPHRPLAPRPPPPPRAPLTSGQNSVWPVQPGSHPDSSSRTSPTVRQCFLKSKC